MRSHSSRKVFRRPALAVFSSASSDWRPLIVSGENSRRLAPVRAVLADAAARGVVGSAAGSLRGAGPTLVRLRLGADQAVALDRADAGSVFVPFPLLAVHFVALDRARYRGS